ncbi:hypothetical protein Glove_707g52 [Diversispora epigaea]|uniref:Uncharacterized protein n=1 Tax=Diversispora epigaea TaxID=1348612 RepID=A0A397G9Z6_9GLOM|nr:hypothetical protein Glove_707g52 [Diversispora epigaea]
MNGSIFVQSKICDKIEQELRGQQDTGIVKINIPIKELDRLNVREEIHNEFKAEIIGEDLFIKYDGGHKSEIHSELLISAQMHNPAWNILIDMICVIENNNLRPDVGIWFRALTFAQNSRPIASLCPPPNVWIEQYSTNIEYVGIAIPYAVNPFYPNPNSGIGTTPAVPTLGRPTMAPYIVHLHDMNNTPDYYIMKWNENLTLRCGWKIEFNIILNIISRP